MLLRRAFGFVFAIIATSIAIACIGIGFYDVVHNVELNQCEMTWMYVWPQYVPIILPDRIATAFPKYGLYYYVEEGRKAKAMEPKKDVGVTGVPVLFLPGNAGKTR